MKIRILSSVLLIIPQSAAFCYPDEELSDCYKKRVEKPKTENSLKQIVRCLGVNKESLAFSGQCQDRGSKCSSGVTSTSLDCWTGEVCCQDVGIKTLGQFRDIGQCGFPSPTLDDKFKADDRDYEDLNQSGCGGPLRTNFVLGGHVVAEGAMPFIVSFTQNIADPKIWKSFCGGTLISDKYVLTAAHCFQNVREDHFEKNIRVRIGVSNLNRTYSDKEKQKRRESYAKIERVILHPNYRRKGEVVLNPINDIAVIKLRLVQGKHKPACLPTRVSKRKTFTSEPGIVAGWGSTSNESRVKPTTLVYAHINHVEKKCCQSKYKEFVQEVRGDIELFDSILCAGDKTADACSGDSGSPLLWVDDKFRWSVAGIVSFGPSVCGQDIPGAYTRVENYLEWIRRVIID